MSTPSHVRVFTFLLLLSFLDKTELSRLNQAWLPSTCTSLPFPSPQALHKKDKNKPQEAKLFSIISFVLVLIFIVSYPLLVATLTLATVFGYLNRPYRSYYYRY